jgi:hypothetical protein
MPFVIRGPGLAVDIDRFLERLNERKTSHLVQTYARRYATTGKLTETEGSWRRADLKPIWAEMSQVTMASLLSSIPSLPVPVEAFRRAVDWLALACLHESHIRLSICPDSECQRFFADVRRRGKSACCPEHANRMRARKHLDRLKKKPRKYRRYLKNQAELMRARRKAGLA